MKQVVHFSKVEKHIAILELDNGKVNTLTTAVKIRLIEELKKLEHDPDIRVLILSSKEGHFCCGDDLKEAQARIHDTQKIIWNLNLIGEIIDSLESLAIPTIAAISGYAIGGGLELALSCDIRIADEKAKFKAAGVNIGISASADKLSRIIGISQAKYLLFTAKEFNSIEALNLGLLAVVTKPESLKSETLELARLISSKAPLALKATKEIANKYSVNKKELNALCNHWMIKLAKTNDHKEAVNAFIENRKAIFIGC